MGMSRQIHGTAFDGYAESLHFAQSDVAHSLEEISIAEQDYTSLGTIGTTLMMRCAAQQDVSKKMNKATNFA